MSKSELKIFIGMSRVINKINRATGKVHLKYGLTTPQFAVLEALYHKGDMTVGEVQEKVLSTSGTIPVIIKNLEKEGLVTKEQDETDKRRFILHITEKGMDLISRVYPENEAIILEVIGKLTVDEQQSLINYMKKIGGD